MFGFRVQSTRQSAHAKDLPATLGHAAHLKAIKRDARPYSPPAASLLPQTLRARLAVRPECLLSVVEGMGAEADD